MIAAHYPARRHPHLAGNYGDAWWRQDTEFAAFNGPIVVTSNCITPVQEAYAGRIFTTGPAAYPGVPHLHRDAAERIDFGPVVALAKTCPSPTPLETRTFVGGFGWRQVAEHAGKILELVRAGKIRRFIVIAGCDGRDPARVYYREVARRLPKDAIILTAGCAKYPFMRLPLGDIEGIPRIIEAGQCNDCYSLVRIAQLLAEATGAKSLNDLPPVPTSPKRPEGGGRAAPLLHLGVKHPARAVAPGFLSPRVRDRIMAAFSLMRIGTAEADVEAMMARR
jgi:hydroxylamine reductase